MEGQNGGRGGQERQTTMCKIKNQQGYTAQKGKYTVMLQ